MHVFFAKYLVATVYLFNRHHFKNVKYTPDIMFVNESEMANIKNIKPSAKSHKRIKNQLLKNYLSKIKNWIKNLNSVVCYQLNSVN